MRAPQGAEPRAKAQCTLVGATNLHPSRVQVADEQTGLLLQGKILEWRREVEKIREVRRMQGEVEASSAADRAQRGM